MFTKLYVPAFERLLYPKNLAVNDSNSKIIYNYIFKTLLEKTIFDFENDKGKEKKCPKEQNFTLASISEQIMQMNAEKDNNFLSNKTFNIYKTHNCSAKLRRVDKNLNSIKSQSNKSRNSKEFTLIKNQLKAISIQKNKLQFQLHLKKITEPKFSIKNKSLIRENQNLTKKCEGLENEKQNLLRENQNTSDELNKYKNQHKSEEFSTKFNEIDKQVIEKGKTVYFNLNNLAFHSKENINAKNETYQKESYYQLINRDYRILATRKRTLKKSKNIKSKCGFPGCDGAGNSRNQDGNIKFISHSSIRFCPNAKKQKSYTLDEMDKVYEQNEPKLIDSLKNIEISNLKNTIEELKKELNQFKTESCSSLNENVGFNQNYLNFDYYSRMVPQIFLH